MQAMLTFAALNLKKIGQLDMEKSNNGLKLKLRESNFHEKFAKIQKGVRNENIPNPFCRQDERRITFFFFFAL